MAVTRVKYAIILLLFLFHSLVYAQPNLLLKSYLTVENGLSHNEITAIVQDNDGFIWIGTRGGLNRYDGYEFKIYNQEPGDSNSLVNPSIESLFVDSKGNIWIGTKSGGVSKYDPDIGKFTNIVDNYLHESELLSDNRIISFFEDKEGKIWMGTWSNGFVVYEENTRTSVKYLEGVAVTSIIQSSDNRIWIATPNGLREFVPGTGKIIQRINNSGSANEIIEDKKRNVLWIAGDSLIKYDLRNDKYTSYPQTGYSILLDNTGKIWLGTWGSGLYTFSPEEEVFQKISVNPEKFINQNKDYDAILYIFQDNEQNIWLGTNGGGLCVLTPKLAFHSVGYNPEPNKGLLNTRVMSVVDDSNGNLWIGTIGNGLIWSPDRENFYPVPCEKNPRLDFFVIKYIFEDSEHRIWTGTNTGTYIVEFENGNPKLTTVTDSYKNFPNIGQGVSFLDFKDQFWYGTLDNGLYVLDKNNNYSLIKHFDLNDPESGILRSDRISFQLKDSKDRIWLGTYNGLHVFNPADSIIHIAEDFFDISGEFTGNIITCMDEDQFGNIWIGTPNGLNRLTESGNSKFEVNYFTENDGLASNFIKGIAHDSNGNIWVSTSTSISMFDVKTGIFLNFNEMDGIRGKNFTEASVFRNKSGELFFGGDYGLTYFKPEEIKPLPKGNKPTFTELKIFNQKVEVNQKFGSSRVLSKSITHTSEIKIPFRFNNFEIQFSALDFKSMGGNTYKYILENLDDEWHNIGARRFVNFNNLSPGEYVLKVKNANNHNIWNENAAQLTIHVLPPFWQTWYALGFYIIVVIAIVTIIRWNAVKQVRLANSLEMEKMQHEQDRKISEMKFQFFTNISHEFRTPLTLILAPLKEILSNERKSQLSDEVVHKIQIIQRNAVRLMDLVNQLLDFRKAETGNMKLNAGVANIENFVKEVCLPFRELAKINEIKFRIRSKLKTKDYWFDREKMEVVLNNLISNSFKFVKENGKVEVSLYEEEEELLISVSDNGSGIPVTELKHVFNRFYRIEKHKNYGSSGIGLALAKKMAELHHGKITVTSEPNVNTEFVVSIPKGRDHLNEEEIAKSEKASAGFVKSESRFTGILPGSKSKAVTNLKEKILIVEDNREVSNYLKSLLEAYYKIITAFDGMEGYRKAVEETPDLIISDVMMPKIDGFELCKRIKTNEILSVTPFVLLTAKNATRFKLLGTQLGADEYIEKPFDPNYLIEKIRNLLQSREKLQKAFSKSIRLEPKNIEITNTEEELIETTISIIEGNLQNPEFSSDMLASKLNMSGSTLYRKLKELTGSSTAEFIRGIRIKRAAQLLADKQKTITEIAYEVGFNDVKHFRTVFQKHFGCAPTEYRDKKLSAN